MLKQILTTLALASAASLAAAQAYPSEPIRLIVGYPPGGGTGVGSEVHYQGPGEFAAFVKADNEKWQRLVRERRLQLD